MIKKYAEVFNLNESANTLNEAKGAMVSKELMKATDKMHTEQLKQQELQKKFVSETDADKKNKMKADLIAQHKKVKDAERNFQEALGREHVDYDDELLETDSQLNEISDNRLIDKFKDFAGDEDVTDLDIEYFAYKNKLTSAQKAKLKNTLLSDFDIKSTGPLPADIRGRIG